MVNCPSTGSCTLPHSLIDDDRCLLCLLCFHIRPTEIPIGRGKLQNYFWLSILYTNVSKNRGTPKWMVYNGKTLLKWMIWGAHPYIWKHPYLCCICFIIFHLFRFQLHPRGPASILIFYRVAHDLFHWQLAIIRLRHQCVYPSKSMLEWISSF